MAVATLSAHVILTASLNWGEVVRGVSDYTKAISLSLELYQAEQLYLHFLRKQGLHGCIHLHSTA